MPQLGVRLIIDAEHSYFQPLINHVAVELQRRYNASEAVIMNTYQGYRKDAHQRCVNGFGTGWGVSLPRVVDRVWRGRSLTLHRWSTPWSHLSDQVHPFWTG